MKRETSQVETQSRSGVLARWSPRLRQIDLLLAFLVSEGIGILGLVLRRTLELPFPAGLLREDVAVLFLVVFPVCAALGIIFAVRVSPWVPWLLEAEKFCIVGLFNSMIDFSILNLLITFLGTTHGVMFSACKAVSFSFAAMNSYAWNRFWTFKMDSEKKRGIGENSMRVPLIFLAVTLVGFVLNVAVASLIVEAVAMRSGVVSIGWANLAAGLSLVISAVWNFLGYRHIAFAHPRNGLWGSEDLRFKRNSG